MYLLVYKNIFLKLTAPDNFLYFLYIQNHGHPSLSTKILFLMHFKSDKIFSLLLLMLAKILMMHLLIVDECNKTIHQILIYYLMLIFFEFVSPLRHPHENKSDFRSP